MPFKNQLAVACLLFALLLAAVPTVCIAQGTSVRVQLLSRESPQQVTVEAPGGELRIKLRDNSNRTVTLGSGAKASLKAQKGAVVIDWPQNTLSTPKLEVYATGGANIHLHHGALSREYRGRLTVQTTSNESSLMLINRLSLQAYLASVVAAEFPFKTYEGAKAQAVVARTYAVNAMRRRQKDSYDLTDNTASQSYKGVGSETSLSRRVARETTGEILTYQSRPIEAVYSASNGGYIASNENVWNSSPVPYLRGKEDPYDTISPHQNWTFSITASLLHQMLSQKYGFTVDKVTFNDQTSAGRHRSVLITGDQKKTVTGNSLRLLIVNRFGAGSLKSTFFNVRKSQTHYLFEGQGFGHGVGLSQWGARARAEDGHSYADILQFYYAGASLTAFKEVQQPALASARQEQKQRQEQNQEQSPPQQTPTTQPTTASTSRVKQPGWGVFHRSLPSAKPSANPPVRPGW